MLQRLAYLDIDLCGTYIIKYQEGKDNETNNVRGNARSRKKYIKIYR